MIGLTARRKASFEKCIAARSSCFDVPD